MKLIKPIALFLIPLFIIASSCKKKKNEDEEGITYNTNQAYTLSDISYGTDNRHKMDIYLPANRSAAVTKVFVLIHGGGWSAGDKSDFQYLFNNLKQIYPNHAIISLNYRLGTSSSPGYPKQLNDIQLALDHIQLPKYELAKEYFFIGGSAGGHLSLLFGYTRNQNNYIKGICNTVGPTDFTDPAYTDNALYQYALASFLGPVTYAQNPGLYAETSPAKNVTATSPKTISFFGDSDPLIPSSQMALLHDELTAKGVYNEATMYAGEGHGGWNQTNSTDYALKLANFINQHFGY